ncbi:MAG: hypothetical protein OXN83_01800, partial [Oligoflexia bacterium]|nr:hypothetical protein [Oligoflexia bacterium]
MRFKDGLNEHDIRYATRTCQELEIRPHFLDLDITEFSKKDIWFYSDSVQVASPQWSTILWAVDQIEGIVILGDGENYFRRPVGS